MAYISPGSTMTQTAGSSVGSPSFRKFGGDSLTGAIRGGARRRRSATDFSNQPEFAPGDISGAMRRQENIMFEPKEIPGMNPLVGKSPGFEYGQARGPDVSFMPSANMGARRRGLTPFSMPTFSSSIFVPGGSDTIIKKLDDDEPIITKGDDEPIIDKPIVEGGRYTDEEEKREDEKLHPYGGSDVDTEVDTFTEFGTGAVKSGPRAGKTPEEAKTIAQAVDIAMAKGKAKAAAMSVMSVREKSRLSGRERAEVEAKEEAAKRGAFSSDVSYGYSDPGDAPGMGGFGGWT